jgi:hypothetical protein
MNFFIQTIYKIKINNENEDNVDEYIHQKDQLEDIQESFVSNILLQYEIHF